MTTKLVEKVPRQRMLILLAGVCSLTLVVQAQESNAPTVLKPTVVTGSYIPTAETVTAAPVDTLTATDIEKIGAQDVLDLVKKVDPAFAGNGNVGQTVNNGGFGEANVLIRNLPTLILLNGHRLGNSAFSNGQLVDVNTIPLAAIERVEILKDGASALYGSQAIGGVVNIITKKDFSGAEIGGRYGFATGEGTFTEYRVSAVGAVTTEKGSITAGFQYYKSDPLITSDRKIASLDNQERADLGLAGASYISPSYNGKVQAGTGNGTVYLLANSPFLAGLPGYNPNLLGGPVVSGQFATPGSPPVYPGAPVFSGANSVANYNAYATDPARGALRYVDPTGSGYGPYVPTRAVGLGSATLLNTTEFGTHSIQSQDRKQAFGSGSYDLIEKRVQLFGEFLYANLDSVGALAPSPVLSLPDPTANIFVPYNNAYNPFGIDLGPTGLGGATTPRVRSRFIESGNRIFDNQTDYAHFTGGLKGDLDNDWHYEGTYNYNLSDQIAYTRNAINGAALDLALKPNPDPVRAAQGLSQLRDSSGEFLPMYNIFYSPTASFPTTSGPNDPRTINALRTTLFQSGRSEEWDAGGVITGAPFELPGGKFGFAAGGGFMSESLKTDFDGLTKLGKAPGLNPADPTSGRRDSYNLFIETHIPLTSPDMDIPALYSVDLTAAGRFESFDPGGDSAVPKVGLRWQPLDKQVTLRGSYSKSFVAPTTYQLFGGSALNNPFLVTSDAFAQESTVNLSNPGLKAVDAENYGGGIVISPKVVPGLTVSLDYYHVQTKNDIFRYSEQAMVNDLETGLITGTPGSGSRFARYFRFNDGSQLTTTAPDQITSANWGIMQVPLGNGAEVETEGLDLTAAYSMSQWQDTAGVFTLYANANVPFSYKYQDPLIGGPYEYKGFYTDRVNGIGGAQGLIPDWQIAMGLTWEYKNFTYNINARYIPPTEDPGTLFASNLDFERRFDDQLNDYTADGSVWKVDSWYSIDMQLAYEFKNPGKWYNATRLAIGVNNVTDNDPPIIASSFEDNTDKSTYDILGRFIYFEISKKF